MKTGWLVVSAAMAVVVAQLGWVGTVEGAGSKQAQELFANPPAEYAPAPLWVWNDMLTEQQIRDTLHDMADQKVMQVFVHPRPGLMTPYLSDEWFKLWKVAIDEGRKLGHAGVDLRREFVPVGLCRRVRPRPDARIARPGPEPPASSRPRPTRN